MLAANSCAYKPIFSDKSYNFEINEVFFSGEKDINRIIDSKLKFVKNSDGGKKKNYTIELTSTKKREVQNITKPTIKVLVAPALTKAKTISKVEIGAAKIS